MNVSSNASDVHPSTIGLVAMREIRRNLRTRKAVASIALFLIGGAFPVLLHSWIGKLQLNLNGQVVEANQMDGGLRRTLLEKMYDADVAAYLEQCPGVLLFLFRGTLIFLPLLVLLLGYDLLIREVQHGTVRYYLGRVHRTSFIMGKALGTWTLVVAATLLLYAGASALAFSQGIAMTSVLRWGLPLWLFTIVYGAVYVAFTTLLSSLCKTPSIALIGGVGILCTAWIANTLLSLGSNTAVFTWVFPGTCERLLVSPHLSDVVVGTALLGGWTVGFLSMTSFTWQQRDL